jgi:hypothetical protein
MAIIAQGDGEVNRDKPAKTTPFPAGVKSLEKRQICRDWAN